MKKARGMAAPKRNLVGAALFLMLCLGSWAYFDSHVRVKRKSLDGLVQDLQTEPPIYWRWYWRWFGQSPSFRQKAPMSWRRNIIRWEMGMEGPRVDAVVKIVNMGTNAWPAIPALLDLLEHNDFQVASSAGNVLVQIKADQSPDWPGVSARLKGRSKSAAVFRDLAATQTIVESRRYEDSRQRQFGLIGLAAAETVGVAAIPEAASVLQSKEGYEHWAMAVEALKKMGSSMAEFVPFLGGVLQDANESPYMRAAAARALGLSDLKTAEIRGFLQEARADQGSSFLRLAGARSLWRWDGAVEETLAVLKPLLSHKLIAIRAGALDGISEMGSAAQSVRADVVRLATDEDESVRRAAASALKSLDGVGVESVR